MKRKLQDTTISKFVGLSVATILVLVPFHAFLTVWLSSGVGHYTVLRLWKEVLLLVAGTAACYLLLKSADLKQRIRKYWLWRLVAAYVLLTIVAGAISYTHGSVTLKAVLYGELLNVRPFVMLIVAWVAATTVPWLYTQWHRLVLWPAAGVVTIGLLQYFVLPHDVMKHFGYNAKTIWPYETIDHKTTYIRIRSTLRGANLLGGYMILVLGLLGTKLLATRKRLVVLAAVVASLVVMFASGSRGAWLGLIAAAMTFGWLRLNSRQARQLFLEVLAMSLIVVSGTVVLLRNNDFVQNTVFHTDEHSTSKVSSNSAHVAYSIDAAKEIITEPLGRGPGTAGPASVYNAGHPARIAENYFLQIGQETGWLGLGLFLAIYALLAWELWLRRKLLLAQVLLASLAGLSVMALLMHIWTDDTIAYLWFGLAGILLAQPLKREYAKAD
jgi:hypothetical protein